MKRTALISSVVFCLIFLSTSVFADKPTDKKSFGQTVYVPAVYNVYDDNQLLITRIVIRNVDPEEKITVNSVAFYDPDGGLVKEVLDDPVDIESWSSKTYVTNYATLEEHPYPYDGGRPCFIVKWEAEKKVIAPIIGSAIAAWNTTNSQYMGITGIYGKVIE